MALSLRELHKKDVIQSKTGENLGRIDDVSLDPETARVESVILRGRPRLFGLLGSDEDLVIPWEGLRHIGADVIMVEAQVEPAPPRRRRWMF